jgi:DHA1 family inner membrane transport protein
LLSIVALVPYQESQPGNSLRVELAAFRSPQVWLALAMTMFSTAGVFASFTYIAPMMTELAGFPAGAVPWLLALFGVGLVAGNLLGGWAAEHALMVSLYVVPALLALVLAVFTVTTHAQLPAAITIALFGVASFASAPALQTRVITKTQGAPALASAANIAAFNVGIAGGAWLGGLAIKHGLGYVAPNWIGAILASCGLTVALFSGLLDRRSHSMSSRVETP